MFKKIISLLLLQSFLIINLSWAQGSVGDFDNIKPRIDTLAPEVMVNTNYFNDAFSLYFDKQNMRKKDTLGNNLKSLERRNFLKLTKLRQGLLNPLASEKPGLVDDLLEILNKVTAPFQKVSRRTMLIGMGGGVILTLFNFSFNITRLGFRSANNIFAADSMGVVERLISYTGNLYDLDIAREGIELYTDRGYTIESLPENLEGTVLVKTPNDDKHETGENVAEFMVNEDSIVYRTYQPGFTELMPEFLANYIKTDMIMPVVGLEGEIFTHEVYYKIYAAGETVILGGNLHPESNPAESWYNGVVFVKGFSSNEFETQKIVSDNNGINFGFEIYTIAENRRILIVRNPETGEIFGETELPEEYDVESLNVSHGATVTTITWDANTESDLAGYKVYIDENADGKPDVFVDVGNVTVTKDVKTMAGIATYWVTAYDKTGNESDFPPPAQLTITQERLNGKFNIVLTDPVTQKKLNFVYSNDSRGFVEVVVDGKDYSEQAKLEIEDSVLLASSSKSIKPISILSVAISADKMGATGKLKSMKDMFIRSLEEGIDSKEQMVQAQQVEDVIALSAIEGSI